MKMNPKIVFSPCTPVEVEELPAMPHYEEKDNIIVPTEEFIAPSDYRDYSISSLKDAGIPINNISLDSVVSPSDIDSAIENLDNELKKNKSL